MCMNNVRGHAQYGIANRTYTKIATYLVTAYRATIARDLVTKTPPRERGTPFLTRAFNDAKCIYLT